MLDLWRESRQDFTLRLEGRSMVPVAAPGDRLTIRPLEPRQLRCGDLIALRQGEALVVHRFLMARTAGDGGRRYCQKGDNSPAWSWVSPDALFGRVTAISTPRLVHDLSRRPWTWFNPLAGRLGRWRVLLAGGGRARDGGFQDAAPRRAGRRPLSRLIGRLRRGLVAGFIHLAGRPVSSPGEGPAGGDAIS
jgi:hypothetical protein